MPRYRKIDESSPARSTNDETWNVVIDSLPQVFGRDDPPCDAAWKGLDTLMTNRRIRQIDMFALQQMLRAAYDAGKADGAEDS